MELKYEAVYHGPNPHADEAVMVARLRITAEASVLEAGCSRLRDIFPDWFLGGPSPLFGATPVQRVAHAAAVWALAALNEVRGCLHSAGVSPCGPGDPSTAQDAVIFLAYHRVAVSRQALELALKAIQAAGRDKAFSRETLRPALDQVWQLCRRHHPDWQARILIQGARSRDIPVMLFLNGGKYWQYGWGSRSRVFFETASNADGYLGGQFANSKVQTKLALSALGIPAPPHVLVADESELEKAAQAVGWPCVVKPMDMGGGKGVTAGINSPGALKAAFMNARRYTKGPLMVEAHCHGIDHRLFLLDGRLAAAVRREPSSVTGDGVRTVRQLIDELNAGRSQNLLRSQYLVPVAFDALLDVHLDSQGVHADAVLAPGQKVSLRSNANRSTGGVAHDVLAGVHPQVRIMAESLAQVMGLYAAGFDYITSDISQSPAESGGQMIEINTTPGLGVLVTAGLDPVALAGSVLGDLPSRIPVVLCVIEPGVVESVRAHLRVNHVRPSGAWVCGNEAFVAGMGLKLVDRSPWEGVRAALRYRCVESLLIVCTEEDIVHHGLPLDKVNRTVLCGVRFAEPWHEVLRRCSTDLSFAQRWEQGLAFEA